MASVTECLSMRCNFIRFYVGDCSAHFCAVGHLECIKCPISVAIKMVLLIVRGD